MGLNGYLLINPVNARHQRPPAPFLRRNRPDPVRPEDQLPSRVGRSSQGLRGLATCQMIGFRNGRSHTFADLARLP